MILLRSPTLLSALIFTLISITLVILTVTIQHESFENPLRTLIICPPVNSLLSFIFAATWIERRFRLSYLPFLCLLLLFSSSFLLTIISARYLTVSLIIYFNLIFYLFSTLLFFSILLVTSIAYSYGFLFIHRHRNMMTIEQQNGEIPENNSPLKIDEFSIRCSSSTIDDIAHLTLNMSKLPGRRVRHDIRNIQRDLEQIHVDTVISLNEIKELSFMDMTKKNSYNMDTYAMYLKRANIEHLLYPIRDRFIPKSISDYIQFLFSLVINSQNTNRRRVLIHCMGGMGRTGLTAVCIDLIFEYLITDRHKETTFRRKQTLVERLCHYPFLLPRFCRVCRSIIRVRQTRPGTIHNPLQVIFAHEFYARLRSTTYMKDIRLIIEHEENLLSNHQDQ